MRIFFILSSFSDQRIWSKVVKNSIMKWSQSYGCRTEETWEESITAEGIRKAVLDGDFTIAKPTHNTLECWRRDDDARFVHFFTAKCHWQTSIFNCMDKNWKKLMENNATQSEEEFLNWMILKLGAIIVDWLLSEERKEGGPFKIFFENNSR